MLKISGLTRRPHWERALGDRDLDAEAVEALEAARSMPNGPEKIEALKKVGLLRNAADARGIAFAKRGPPPK